MADLRRNLFEVLGISEIGGAAVGGVEARQIEVPASLTGSLAITFDFAPLALITRQKLAFATSEHRPGEGPWIP